MLKKLFTTIAFGCFFVGPGGCQTAKRFVFGSGRPTGGYTQVMPSNTYKQDAGYGFEPGADVNCQTRGCSGNKPFSFSAALPEGNYKVSVTFGDARAATSTVIKAELRRLMLEAVDTTKGKFIT